MSSDELVVAVEPSADGVVLISVRGSLDGWSDGDRLVDALTKAAEDRGRRTVVDLSGLTFADSTALHALLHGRRSHAAAGVPLVLAGPMNVKVLRLFEVTGTQEAFQFASSVEQARTC
ncbi:STAS domain-containing protein [Streptomyces sp. NBC_00306]|uniref:STAS domain-containing protein n=1 Tax=Streptomyces sp. NBC_00306 TaxID=2975708 RepID=UPI002E2E3D09|nr:STAS domain-containing protein [Streptomyces sp. NBC_00306]